MSAAEVATGYVSIMPSTKGFREALAAEIRGSVAGPLKQEAAAAAAPAGQALGKSLGDNASAAASQSIKRGLGSTLSNFTQSWKAAIDHFGGGAAVAKGLATQASQAGTSLRGLVQGSSALTSATGGLKAGLLGVSGLLGGPWGVAVAGAGLAINGFVQAQQNAKQAADDLLATLNEQTGAFTQKSIADVVAKITADLDRSGDLDRLKSLGVSVTDGVVALQQGGVALDNYRQHIDDLAKTVKGSTTEDIAKIAALRGYASSLVHQKNDIDAANNAWKANQVQQALAAEAARRLGLNTDEVTDKIRAQTLAITSATPKNGSYKSGLADIGHQADAVRAAIARVPKSVRITASSVGLDEIRKKANDTAAALIGMANSFSAANNVIADGERHGADVSATTRRAQRAADSLSTAAKKALRDAQKQISVHNAAVPTSSSKSGSGSSAAKTLAQARATLAADRDGLITALTGDPATVRTTISKVLADASAAGESALTKLLRKDTERLLSLARQRADVSSRLKAAQSNLADLIGQRNSTASSVSQSALGDLVGARSVGGVTRVVTKELELVKSFRGNLRILAKRGLPAPFLQQLVNAGVNGAATAKALANSSDSDFRSISSLVTQLNAESTGLGKDAGNLLYGSGIAAAQGLARGLRSQESTATKAAQDLARSIRRAVEQELGIHSPSRVFRDLGRNTVEGYVQGVTGRAQQAHDAVAGMASARPSSSIAPVAAAVGQGGGVNIENMSFSGVHYPDIASLARAVSDELAWRAQGRGGF